MLAFSMLALNQAAADSPGKIAYTSKHRDFNSEVYVMNSDGTGVQRLTYDLDVDKYPTLSPDGTKVAFVSARASGPRGLEVFVINTDGTDIRQLTSLGLDVGRPAWSPDGTQIAFDAVISGRDGAQIYVVSAAGGTPQAITPISSVGESVQWVNVAGESRIVFYSSLPGSGFSYPYSVRPDGSDRKQEGDGYAGRFSRDGTVSVTTGFSDGFLSSAFYVRRVSDEEVFRVLPLPIFAGPAAFSPDGQSLTFVGYGSGRSDLPDVYRINLDGTNFARLTTTDEADSDVSWSLGATAPVTPPPAGNGRIIFTTSSVFTVNSMGWDVRKVLASGRRPTWSGDGTRIAAELGNTSILTANADGSNLLEIKAPADWAYFSGPALSPDGSRMAYEAKKDTSPFDYHQRIFIMNSDGTNDKVIPEAGSYIREDPERPSFFIESGGPGGVFYGPAWTKRPQDNRLAYTHLVPNTYATLAVKTVDAHPSSQQVLLADVARNTSEPNWSPDGTRITYIQSERQDPNFRHNVMTISSSGGEPVYVTNTAFERSPQGPSSPSFSPDGQRIAFAHSGIFTINADGTGRIRLVGSTSDFDGGSRVPQSPEWGANNASFVPDTLAPTVTIGSLVANESTRLREISGTAQDTTAGTRRAGVGVVWLTLRRGADNLFWNPGSTQRWTPEPALLPTELERPDLANPGPQSWSCVNQTAEGPLPGYDELPGGAYEVTAFSIDIAGNRSADQKIAINVIKPGNLSLSETGYVIDEQSGAVTPGAVTVLRTGGSDGTVSVEYFTSSAGDGTPETRGQATAGVDYQPVSGTLTFGPGETSKVIVIAPINDTLIENTETLELTLRNASSTVELTSTVAGITISDDEVLTAGTFRFFERNPFAREDGGSTVVTIKRTGGSTGAVTLELRLFAQSSPSPVTDISGPVTFAAGETSKAITIPLVDDAEINGARTVSLNFSHPVLGDQAFDNIVLSVLDDETLAVQGTFAFDQSSYQTGPVTGKATLNITRSGGNAGAVALRVFPGNEPGAPVEGSDYFIINGSMNFGDGDSAPRTVEIIEISGRNLGGKRATLLLTQNGNVIGTTIVSFSSGGGGTGGAKPDAFIGTVLGPKKTIKKAAGQDIYSTDGSQAVIKTVNTKKRSSVPAFYVAFENDGGESGTFSISGPATTASGFEIKYTLYTLSGKKLVGKQNVSAQIVSGVSLGEIVGNAGDDSLLKVQVVVPKKSGVRTEHVDITLTSTGKSPVTDVVRAVVETK